MRCLYQSLAFYQHRVFQCKGVTPDKQLENDYTIYYTTGEFEGHKVIVLDQYKGDLILEDGTLFIDVLSVLTVQTGDMKGKKVVVLQVDQNEQGCLQVVPLEKYPNCTERDILTMKRFYFQY